MKKLATIGAALAAVVVLGGCMQHKDKTPPAPDWDAAKQRAITDRIAKSAERATDAVETLVMIERTRAEPLASVVSEKLHALPAEMSEKTTVDWSGPGVGLVKELAREIGYSFITSGNAPPVEPMISLRQNQIPMAKVLENVGVQISPRADVIVDPNARRIEYRYADVR